MSKAKLTIFRVTYKPMWLHRILRHCGVIKGVWRWAIENGVGRTWTSSESFAKRKDSEDDVRFLHKALEEYYDEAKGED